METKKENKKGFWASLFSPKPCSCSCGSNLIVEEPEKPETSCCCGDKSSEINSGVTEIKILGPGCAKCKSTYQVIERVVSEKCEDDTNLFGLGAVGYLDSRMPMNIDGLLKKVKRQLMNIKIV